MMAPKQSKTYTDEDFTNIGDSACERAVGPGGYHVLAYLWAYRGGCGGECTGIWSFRHMLDALSFFLRERYDLASDALGKEETEEWENGINEQIDLISTSKSDENAYIDVLDFDAGNAGFSILASGYWDDFVFDAIDYFISDLSENSNEELEDEGTKDMDDDKFEDDSDYGVLGIDELKSLRDAKDIHSAAFISDFSRACDDFDMRKNG